MFGGDPIGTVATVAGVIYATECMEAAARGEEAPEFKPETYVVAAVKLCQEAVKAVGDITGYLAANAPKPAAEA